MLARSASHLSVSPAEAFSPVAVARPHLPGADAILPYLRRIDAARWYSNFGPLLTEFEERLAARFHPGTEVVTCANATQALALTLQAMGLPRRGLCAMPSYSFVASAHAVIAAGLTPYFLDVDLESWTLTPDTVRRALKRAPGAISAVMVVAPFGAVPDLEAWLAFRADTGIPVIVDAAAAFDQARAAPLPVVVSLHATKVLGVGEGGFVATEDAALAADVRRLTTFGFRGSRQSEVAATNAKLSEYAAAVGLAALDAWPHDRLRYARAATLMRAAMVGLPEIVVQAGWGASWVTSVLCVRGPDGCADALGGMLAEAGVETRRWWGLGCADSPAFAACPKEALPHTEVLGASVVGLPFAIDLDRNQISRVAAALHFALGRL
jgi:dTDP-4-amino-4,6-dideoxygalactose transaminase